MRARWLAWLFVMGCGAPAPAPVDASVDALTCPNDLPAACPTPIPSWSGAVQAIVQTECLSCHGAGAAPTAAGLLDSYALIYAHRQTVLDKIYDCSMPPPPAVLSSAERATLLAWLVCGAPDN